MYSDVGRKGFRAAPQVDAYTVGCFCCQPWSTVGKPEGLRGAKGRGKVFHRVGTYIKEREPKNFCLDNAKALTCTPRSIVFEK
eukprot:1617279-Lingulodinium_polyedra.AAC.1